MKKFILFLITLFLYITYMDAEAQRRTTYQSLLQRSDQPASYIDHIVLPETDSTATAAVFFRLDYDFVPFLRKRPNMTPPSPEAEYFSAVRMGLEVFSGQLTESRRGAARTGTSVFRDTWRDTVWVNTFEDTRSRFDHIEGVMQTSLGTGDYNYELQLGRGESTRELPSRRRDLRIPDFSELEQGQIMLASSVEKNQSDVIASLLNYGNNVLYGQNFDLLILLPGNVQDNSGEKKFKVEIHRLQAGSGSDVVSGAVFSYELSEEDMFIAQRSEVVQSDEGIRVNFSANRELNGYRYASVRIPNEEYENARYRVQVMREGQERPVARRIINSQWIDMPVSLYNLDVAIDMLRFIVSDSELRRINSGSASERERKFREFWAQRDPTPDTEFNELMAEYYRRIDYAYQNFSSLQTPGFDTDQGKAYILYGAPLSVERRLPTGSPAREIWEYPNRTLIFEATTGFGDFRLISES